MMAAVECGVGAREWVEASAANPKVDGAEEAASGGTFDRVSRRIGRSIAERRAATFPGGEFGTPKISVARFRSADSPVGSPCLTIPAGLSPTALLDSPVMLLNSQALPSPTTGSFAPLPLDYDFSSDLPTTTFMDVRNENDESVLYMKPQLDSLMTPCLQNSNSEAQRFSGCQDEALLKQEEPKNPAGDSPEENTNNVILQRHYINLGNCYSGSDPGQINQSDEFQSTEDIDLEQVLDKDETETSFPNGMGKPSEDGYNWRKYGQKNVKGSEYPRSYYKCTHLNCPVKKKVERSHDGQITEIVYRSAHNHPKPQPAHRSAVGVPISSCEYTGKVDLAASFVKTEERSLWSIPQDGNDNGFEEWQKDGSDKMSSTSTITDVSVPLTPNSGKLLIANDSIEQVDISFTVADRSNEDAFMHVSLQLKNEYAEEEPESKRRKTESSLDTDVAPKNIREDRVILQTESENDILDDGYRWRKYGQKVVKGNPNPRSYYKCTYTGCTVKKHVERAADDLKSVITTYEGKHNHEVPTARTTGQNSSSSGNGQSSSTSSVSSTGSSNVRKSDGQGLDLIPHFGGKLNVTNGGYMRSAKYTCDARAGLTQICETKLPAFPHLPFCNFGFSPTHTDVPQVSTGSNVIADCAFPLPISFHRPFNPHSSGFGYNAVQPTASAIQSLFVSQPVDNASKFLRPPKQEQNEDSSYSSISVDNYLKHMNDYL